MKIITKLTCEKCKGEIEFVSLSSYGIRSLGGLFCKKCMNEELDKKKELIDKCVQVC